ncbi:aspartate/glutamate racemase family protein [Nocardia puris]|uniref:Hydantoin racemase n=1 Tax=Nocardia puris TaxID=208602 RepID=A0A366DHQ2_9NOCA|nr:aspartate/glutamate racemase family protein [Nocardia puris]MBF6213428.1 aspartate/glutamate racemase family protein [Nocardia puris]MBF6369403.1 aspartate/glutamate racemase family protein [Nocardia puris]MBF6462308.1 aspartate/glutamate racemase family protein [Nocardia puris]RBO89617.1 allantoin racemase [Nocardia puris]
MRIRVVNPNTTRAMTDLIERCAGAVAGPGTRLDAVTATMGPPSIESHYDEALSVPGVLDAIRRGEADGVDGYVLACFGDPGLDAARELAAGPVVGIAEAAMRTAAHLGRGFSVVTTLGRTAGRAADLADRYGMRRFCLGVHACELPVLSLHTDPDARKIITEACRTAVETDGSDAVVLGCAGMADLCAHLREEIGVPVVDGVAAATLTVQSLVAQGLRKSGRGEFASPPPKEYVGLLRDFGTG